MEINKEKIINIFKISISAIISIFIALELGLEHSISAGIVTILTIQPTKKETIKTAFGRFIAYIVSLILAFFSFKLFGFGYIGFALFIIFYVLVCVLFNWINAISINAVLVSHILVSGNMNYQTIKNETLIFIIGAGIGIIANLHLKKNVFYIEELKEKNDLQIKEILFGMSKRILEKDEIEDNFEAFMELKKSIRKAKNVAEENYNNQLLRNDIYDIEYIKMRDNQCHMLYQMYKTVIKLKTTPITAEKISKFLEEMAKTYHKDNTGKELLEKFYEIDKSMKSKPLPIVREEFEDRAKLFMLLRYIEEFIQIKVEFSERKF
ncbi:MAG: hypothetical protein IJA34_17030 [Lachnospiraceae bacterium]|nr:hypothetical protein [Lachnospiraceae bacterium]